MTTEKKQAPFATLNDRGLSAGIFASSNGFSINFQRSYKKKDSDEYTRETIHFFEEDLLRGAELLRDVYAICRDNRDEIKKLKENSQSQDINNGLDDDIPF